MAIGHLTPEALKAMRDHGHFDCWEVATYAEGESVTVECTRCGEVLVELCNYEAERKPDEARDALWKRIEEHCECEDLDGLVHDLVSQDASAINNAGLQEQFDYVYDHNGATELHRLLEGKGHG